MPKTVKPGLYEDVPFSEYLEWDAANNSTLRVLAEQSPSHAKAYRDSPPPTTEALAFGKAFHYLLLEPKKFDRDFVVAPKCNRRTKEGKQLWEAFLANANGKEHITYDDYAHMKDMCKIVQSKPVFRYFERGKTEVCIVWIDKETGLLCKARTDYARIEDATIVDLKSTRDAHPVQFARSVARYNYIQQAAWYSDGWEQVTGDFPAFVFLPIEKTYPYEAAAYEVSDEQIQAGRNIYRPALRRFAECKKTNVWPGYGEKAQMLTMPKWWLQEHGVHQYNL